MRSEARRSNSPPSELDITLSVDFSPLNGPRSCPHATHRYVAVGSTGTADEIVIATTTRSPDETPRLADSNETQHKSRSAITADLSTVRPVEHPFGVSADLRDDRLRPLP
jgi:hypothetical protein